MSIFRSVHVYYAFIGPILPRSVSTIFRRTVASRKAVKGRGIKQIWGLAIPVEHCAHLIVRTMQVLERDGQLILIAHPMNSYLIDIVLHV